MNVVDNQTELIPLFSMPLYKSYIEPLKDSVVEAIKNMEYNYIPSVTNESNINQYGLVTDSKTLHMMPKFLFLKSIIDSKVSHFTKQVLCIDNFDLKMHTMWAVKHTEGNWAFKHSHKNCLISGILYVDVHPNCGAVVFEKPLHYLNLFPSCFTPSYTHQTIYNSSVFGVEPENNMILLFPSHLEHFVLANNSGKDRYCLSFDYFLNGQIKVS
jgi:uncharacterized protein (TIGR02466 family)